MTMNINILDLVEHCNIIMAINISIFDLIEKCNIVMVDVNKVLIKALV